ncbi:MAG: iron permease, partial [Planctomycetia bacterium]
HSLADGAALAASIDADASHGVGLLAGFATFLAVLLHKPFDAGIIATLMINAGVSPATRRIVNAAYAAIVPLGAMLFLGSLHLYGGSRGTVVGAALALAAGAFLCIAAADLLPEVEFHSHDRLLLTAALTLGITIAWGITVMERSSHAHAVHGGSPAAAHDHR